MSETLSIHCIASEPEELWVLRVVSELARGVDLLAPAEEAVARLAISGLSNAQIATLRGVSPRTVANQLSRAYAKLGLRSRPALARHLRVP